MVEIYKAVSDFWHRNMPVAAGERIALTAQEAKYLIGTAVQRVEDVIEALEEAVVEVGAEIEEAAEEVVEAVKGRRRHAKPDPDTSES